MRRLKNVERPPEERREVPDDLAQDVFRSHAAGVRLFYSPAPKWDNDPSYNWFNCAKRKRQAP